MSGKRDALEAVNRMISEVHRRPELWNRQHPQHHNRSVLDRHWETVAAGLGMTSKAARGKWKNLKDHFRKEYKRCMTMDSDQILSRWPYFHSMMFIKEQISHTVRSSVYLSDYQYQNMYPEVEMGEEESEKDNPLNCLNIECENSGEVKSEYSNQDENISDDKHFLLSLLPMLSSLPLDKKLKARIAMETSLLNIAYPDQIEQNGISQKSTKAEKRKWKSDEERPKRKRSTDEK